MCCYRIKNLLKGIKSGKNGLHLDPKIIDQNLVLFSIYNANIEKEQSSTLTEFNLPWLALKSWRCRSSYLKDISLQKLFMEQRELCECKLTEKGVKDAPNKMGKSETEVNVGLTKEFIERFVLKLKACFFYLSEMFFYWKIKYLSKTSCH